MSNLFGWDYPPGVTSKMIDDFVGDDDEGTEIDTEEGYTIVVLTGNYPNVELQICDKDGGIISEYTLSRGQAAAMARAINERI